MALGGAVAVLALLAGPAGAQTTTTVLPANLPAGSTAIDGSVSSGTAFARNNSTASGDAVAANNSTASGCSTAVNNSTASGDTCPPPTVARPPQPPGGGGGGGGGGAGGGGAGGGAAGAASASLALTGSWSGLMMATAALAILLGTVLVVATGRRRASSRA